MTKSRHRKPVKAHLSEVLKVYLTPQVAELVTKRCEDRMVSEAQYIRDLVHRDLGLIDSPES